MPTHWATMTVDDLYGNWSEIVDSLPSSAEMGIGGIIVYDASNGMPMGAIIDDTGIGLPMSSVTVYSEGEGDHLVPHWMQNHAPDDIVVVIAAWLGRLAQDHNFDYCESGIVVRANGQVERRQGTSFADGEELLGGWCNLHMHGWTHKTAISRREWDTDIGPWKTNPASMLQTTAVGNVLEKHFPELADPRIWRQWMCLCSRGICTSLSEGSCYVLRVLPTNDLAIPIIRGERLPL